MQRQVRGSNSTATQRLTVAGLSLAAMLSIAVNSGCQQLQCVFHVPGEDVIAARAGDPVSARLAGYAPVQDEVSSASTNEVEKTTAPAPVAADDATDTDASSNALAAAYTAPQYTSPEYLLPHLVTAAGQLATSRTLADANVAGATGDALVSGSGGVLGRAGLTGSTATLGTTLVSRPGLQDGPATGLGFAILERNVFSRQANPLSGATGGCAALTRAGFFGGDRTACERAGRR